MQLVRFSQTSILLRVMVLAAAWIGVALGAAPASAQQVTGIDAPSPEAIAVTAGGVDIRTGRYALSETDLSIGSGPGAIELKRIMATPIKGHVDPFGNLSHNWDITLVVRPKLLVPEPYNDDQIANVNFGGRSQTFEWLNSPQGYDIAWRQKSQNDHTRLTMVGLPGAQVYTFQATDGTIATFRPMAATTECSDASLCAFVSNIVEPDGARFDFEYESTTATIANRTRLRSVTSSRGYALLFEYSTPDWNFVSKACVINLGSVAKPANNSCPAGASAVTSYGYAGNRLASVSRPDANVATYSYAPVGTGTSYNMAFKKPGQATPWQTINYDLSPTTDGDLEPIVMSQAFADGSGFVYTYDFSPPANSSQPNFETVVGGTAVNALGHMVQIKYDFPPDIDNGSGNCTSADCVPQEVGSGGGSITPYDTFSLQVTPGPVRIVDPLGRETLMDYCDPIVMAGLPPSRLYRCLVTRKQSARDPEGNMVKLKYGVNSNLIEIRHVAKPGSGLADIVETASYDTTACSNYLKTCDKPLTVVDAKGKVTDYTWDANSGLVLTETRPDPVTGGVRPQKRYSYVQTYAWYKNSAGTLVQSPYPVWLLSQTSECRSGAAPACVGTADETRTTYSYGPSGTANNLLPVSVTIAAGDNSISATSSWTYDTLGNKLTEDGPLPGTADTTRWRYDSMRRVVGLVTPDPDGAGALKFRATRNTYDPAGRLVKAEQGTVNSQSDTDWAAFAPLLTTEIAYDALDRKVKEWSYGTTGGTQQLTQYNYDLAGRLDCTAVRMNPAAFANPPASACTLGPQGVGANDYGPDRITKLTYDAAGQVLKTTVAYGVVGEQTDQETNTYTLNGKLATVTDGENNKTTFEYDGHDRPLKTRYPVPALGALASSTTDFEQLTYDANSNIILRRTRDNQSIAYSYDNLNRMTLKNVPNTNTGEYDVTTAYDNFDRPITVNDSQNNFVGANFDALGRMTAQSSPHGVIGMTYDPAGRLTKVTHPDGVFFDYTYNTSDLTGIVENGTTSLISYTSDDLGRRTTTNRGNGTSTAFNYDPVGRLGNFTQNLTGTANDLTINGPASAGTMVAYNPASQISVLSRSNDLYAWTAHYNVNRNYGTNGLNQLTSAGATTLGYDGRGNLTSSTSGAVTSNYTYTSENRMATGPGGATLYYDPTGRLSRLTQGALTTKLEYLGPRLVIERNSAGTILRRYAHGPGDDEPVVWYEGSGLTQKRWLHADERGSVIAVSDATGTAIATNRYDEYGIPQASNIGRFQYTGQAWIAELGLYYYKARMYSPTLGRFMQTDPIGYEDGINWYAYVDSDPVNSLDSNGERSGPIRVAVPPGNVRIQMPISPPRIRGAPSDYRPRPEPPSVCPSGGCRSMENRNAYVLNNNRVDSLHMSIIGFGSFNNQSRPGEGLANSNRAIGRIQHAFERTTFLRTSSIGTYNFNGGNGGLQAAESFAQSLGGTFTRTTGTGSVYSLSGLPSGTTGTVSTYQSDGYARATVTLKTSVTETGSRIPREVKSEFKVRFD